MDNRARIGVLCSERKGSFCAVHCARACSVLTLSGYFSLVYNTNVSCFKPGGGA
jgi:hypothetical protein